jgi:methanogenic corrinoid protein MtbC1
MLARLDEFERALLALDRVRVSELLDAVAASQTPLLAVESLIRPALERIGKLWEDNRCALSQVYMSGRLCEEQVDALLGPAATTTRVAPGNARLALTVLEDYHLLGKQIVRTVLRAAGWPVLDYERQTVAGLVTRTCADEIDILMISTLMLPSALQVREVTTQLREQSPRTRVVVGGAPFRFDPELWKEVGADAMGTNAAEAVAIVEGLAGGAP